MADDLRNKTLQELVEEGGVVFQLAEVAVPRALFAEILRRIECGRGRRRSRHEDRER